jgi:hypothetical protein
LLTHENLSNLKLLAARADALHTHHMGNSNTVVDTVANAEVYPEVNAVAGRSGRPAMGHGGGRGGGSRGSGQGPVPGGGERRVQVGPQGCRLVHHALAERPAGLRCKHPGVCSWQGNAQAWAN